MKKPPTTCGGLGAVLALLALGCGGNDAPQIEVVGLSPGQIVASDPTQRDLTISIIYQDDDGDLTGGSIRLVDQRTLTQPMPKITVQTLPSPPAAVGVTSGILRIRVARVDVVARDGEELRYELTLFDKAGHPSNVVVTTPVIVRR